MNTTRFVSQVWWIEYLQARAGFFHYSIGARAGIMSLYYTSVTLVWRQCDASVTLAFVSNYYGFAAFMPTVD